MNYENLLFYAGEFGIVQAVLFLLLGIPIMLEAFELMAGNLMIGSQEHWCTLPYISNMSYDEVKSALIPWDQDSETYESCFMYDIDCFGDDCSFGNFSDAPLKDCSAWSFDTSTFSSTVISEWFLVCSQAWMADIVSVMWPIGTLLGSLLSGYASDRFGRKKTLIGFLLLHILASVLTSISPNIYFFYCVRLLVIVFTRVGYLAAFVQLVEVVGVRYRARTGLAAMGMFALGVAVSAGFGYVIRDFRNLQLTMGLVVFPVLLYSVFLPESPRWLTSKDRKIEAAAVLSKFATLNRRSIPDMAIDQFCTKDNLSLPKTDTTQTISFFHIFKFPKLKKVTILVHVSWFSACMAYMGISLGMGDLVGDIYTNMMLSGLLEIPVLGICILTLQKYGRIPTLVAMFLIGGVSAFLALPFMLFQDLSLVSSILMIACRSTSGAAYNCLLLYSSEIFPTPVRQRAISSCSALAAASVIFPVLAHDYMASFWEPLPNAVFGVVCIIGGICAIWLPETRGAAMPESFEDAENIGQYNRRKRDRNTKVFPQAPTNDKVITMPMDSISEPQIFSAEAFNQGFVP